MNHLIRKFGPLVAVFAVLTWLCWEQLGGEESALDLGGAQAAKLARELLNPVVPSPSKRNPFVLVNRKPKDDPDGRPSEHSGAPLVSIEVAKPIEPEAIVSEFSLQGICYGGRLKNAVINGKLCVEGELVPSNSTYECVLKKIKKDYVIIEIAANKIQLGYNGATILKRAGSKSIGIPEVPEFLNGLNTLFSLVGEGVDQAQQN